MFENYEKFLEDFDSHINSLFEEQRPYVFCKKGCCLCCSVGKFPMSSTEFKYLMQGFSKTNTENKKIINSRIKKLKKLFKKGKNTNFEHSCPFLIANICSVYANRPLICRTFGLVKTAKTEDGQQAAILPDCIYHNLNYSNVFDFENSDFDEEKIKTLAHTVEPKPYNISLYSIYKQCPDKSIDFSNTKNMIEFLNEQD